MAKQIETAPAAIETAPVEIETVATHTRSFDHATDGHMGDITIALQSNGMVTLNYTEVSPEVVQYLLYYALEPFSHPYGAKDMKPAERLAAFQKKLDSALAGTLNLRAMGPRDPVGKELARITEAKFLETLRTKGLSRAAAEKKFGKEKLAEAFQKFADANAEAWRKIAEANVAAASSATASVDLDL